MYVRRLALAMLALVLPATATVALLAPGGAPDSAQDVAFPANYAAGVRYATVNRTDLKQYHELYATPEAIAAAKRGEPFPDGTVLTVRRFKIRLDAAGDPIRDEHGDFIRTELAGFSVMQKHRGWGEAYPEVLRNGDWKYRVFGASAEIDHSADPTRCMQCHKPLERQDFVFSLDRMKRLAD